MESNQDFRRMRRTVRWIFASVIIAVGTLIVLSLLFGRFSPAGYPPFFFFGWWIFIPLFFFGFFFFRWWGWVSWWYSGRRHYNDYDPALETLRERFARGEITKEQYDQMRRDLGETQ